MSTLGIIPARGGSKRLPGKNIKVCAGKPLIAWTIEAAQRSGVIDRLVVSSDDPEILDVAAKWGAVPILRPDGLANDTTPTLPVLQHAVEWAEWAERTEHSVIAHLPCTNPLKTAKDIADAMLWMTEDITLESVIGVCEIPSHHPLRVKRMVDGTHYLRDFYAPEPKDGQRQLLRPKAYIRNGSFYIVRRSALMPPDGMLFDHAYSKGFEMPPERSVNIDDEVDFALCELLLERRNRA